VKVEEKGKIAIKISQGNVKLLDAQYIPSLAHNYLISVGNYWIRIILSCLMMVLVLYLLRSQAKI